MKEKIQKLFVCLLGTGILFSLAFLVFAVVAQLGGRLMGIFGFHYESMGQLLIYFLSAALFSLPLELFSTALPRALSLCILGLSMALVTLPIKKKSEQ